MRRYLRCLFGGVLLCTAMTPALAQTALERGRYLVEGILTCGNCHTPKGPKGEPVQERRHAGGSIEWDTPAFHVRGTNITRDRETGIGSWSAEDIKRAIVHGVRPNGVQLAPIMPSAFYKVFTPGDLDAVVTYMLSLPAIRNEVAPPVYKAAIAPETFPGADKPMRESDLKDPVKRGFYLVTVGHCLECHSPMVRGRRDFETGLGKGGYEFKGPWGVSVASNITSHREKGIGAWSDAEIKRAITKGVSRDGRALKPPMSFESYARMTDEDLDAVVAYLRTLPPKE